MALRGADAELRSSRASSTSCIACTSVYPLLWCLMPHKYIREKTCCINKLTPCSKSNPQRQLHTKKPRLHYSGSTCHMTTAAATLKITTANAFDTEVICYIKINQIVNIISDNNTEDEMHRIRIRSTLPHTPSSPIPATFRN
jgi:hypothetical protein